MRSEHATPSGAEKGPQQATAKTYVSGVACKQGHSGLRYVVSRSCVECVKIRSVSYRDHSRTVDPEGYKRRIREQRKNWLSKPGNAARDAANQRARNRKNLNVTLFNKAKTRAKKKGLEFSIELSDVVVPEFCPLLDLKLQVNDGVVGAASPVLDRVENSRGYVKGNVWVISHVANTCKGPLSADDIVKLGTRLKMRYARQEV